ncbi:MAG: EamA family transporter [FCB group bacterium]|nr:EamA family transporter [FCB group bacterium]
MRVKLAIYYGVLSVIWGTTWLAIKVSLNEGMPPIFGAGVRFLIAGIVLWGLFWYRKESLPRSPVAIRLYLLYGIINFGFSYALTYWATQYVYSNLSSLVWAGYPVTVSLLAHWTLKSERLNWQKLTSIFLGFTGVVLIIAQSGDLGGHHVTQGLTMLVISVVIASFPAVYLKKHHSEVNTLQLNSVAQTIAGIVLVSISLVAERGMSVPLTPLNLLATGYLAIFGSVITWLIYFWLFSHLSMVRIAYVALFPPVIATALGWILLGEQLTPLMLLGGVLVVLGGAWVNRTK